MRQKNLTVAKKVVIPKVLLSKGSTNYKTSKNEYRTWILYLSPHTQNHKGINVCPFASKGCIAACLNTAGRGQMNSVQLARRRKTDYMVSNKVWFYSQLAKEIRTKIAYYAKRDETIAFRLNGTSDIDHVKALKAFANFDIKDYVDNAIFYDYTPNIHMAIKYMNHPNYHVSFSKKEDNDHNVDIAMQNGINVAVVFDGDLPKFYKGKRVVDGDVSDMVMVNQKGVVLGLRAKGAAKHDDSGFVVKVKELIKTIRLCIE
jgi:hypothetical protein